MRNLFNKASAAAIAIAAVAMLGSSSANAQGAMVLIDAGNCLVRDAGGTLVSIQSPSAGGDAVVQAVVTPKGNQKVTCNGTLTAGAVPSGRAMIFSGDAGDGLCGTVFGATDDWHQVITKKGKVALSCHVNGQ